MEAHEIWGVKVGDVIESGSVANPINDLAPEDQKMVESFPGVAKVEDE